MGETVVVTEKDDKEDRLCLLVSSISVEIFYAFLDDRPFSGYDDVVEGSIMQHV